MKRSKIMKRYRAMERYEWPTGEKIGKRVRNYVYFHRKYEYLLPKFIRSRFDSSVAHCQIIRYDLSQKFTNFRLIFSHDWDTVDEPHVDEVWSYDESCGEWRKWCADGRFVYHHKWLFVDDDYDGFDIGRQIKRSEVINRLVDAGDIDKYRMGMVGYWNIAVSMYRDLHSQN